MAPVSLIAVFIIFGTLFDTISASRCVVTKWRAWSECLGNCDFAQRVRNRDVIRPPFPEKNTITGEIILRECPSLFEVEYCLPKICEEEPFEKTPKLTHSRNYAPAAIEEDDESPFFTTSHHNRPFFRPVVPKPIPRAVAHGIAVHTGGRVDCGQDKRCCTINRLFCPDGSRPRKVQRFFRQKDEPFCRTYDYPYCDDDVEDVEQPLRYEANCQEVCFSERERVYLPAQRLIR
uniref:Uncharacterized protein n=1 Tax=Panagrellus redivivus TaxID=6233 RepID=A0A7E4UTK9_PANRE